MNLRYILSSYMFFDDRLGVEHLKLVAASGIDAMEMFCYRKHFDWKDQNYVKEIFSSMKSLGIRVHSFHAPFDEFASYDPASLDSRKRERALTEIFYAIKVLSGMGGKSIVIHPGGQPSAESKRMEYLENAGMSLKMLIVFARELGVDVLLENPPSPELGGEASEFREIYDRLMDYRPGFCLDIGHAFISPGGLEGFYAIGKRPDEIHVSDNNGDKDEHLFPGEGSLSLEEVLGRLKYTYGDAMKETVFNFELRRFPGQEKLKNLVEKINSLIES